MQPDYSAGVRHALQTARTLAQRHRHRSIHTEYLLLGLLEEHNSAERILKSLGVERRQALRACSRLCKRGDWTGHVSLEMTPRSEAAMILAGEQMEAMGHSAVDTRHVLLGLVLEEEGIAGNVLRDAGVTAEAVRKAILVESPPEPYLVTPEPLHTKRRSRKSFWKNLLRV